MANTPLDEDAMPHVTSTRARLIFALLLVATCLSGCGDEASSGGDTATADAAGDVASDGDASSSDLQPVDTTGTDSTGADSTGADSTGADVQATDLGPDAEPDTGPVDPPTTACGRLSRVEMAGATEVSNEAALRTALSAGGRVRLTADITAAAPFPVTQPATLDGGGHVISGGGATHLFVVERTDFTIQNVTLRDANNQVDDAEHFSRRSGAAIMATGSAGPGVETTGSLTVIDVVFEDNTIKSTGPGDLRGGALYAFALPDTTVSGSVFRRNVGSNGGAIGGLGSSFRIIDTVFQENRTNGTGPGGALEGHGGAISLDAVSQNGKTAYLDICGARFVDNQAFNGGGAIYLVTHWQTGTAVTIDDSLFDGNISTSESEGQGGAIFLMDDDKHDVPANPVPNRAVITDTTFVDNSVWAQGGGLWYTTVDGRLTLTNVTFDRNRTLLPTTGMGGAFALSGGPADVTNCTFSENWAQFHGGGIQAGGGAELMLRNTLFFNNQSDRDGGWANFHTNRAANVDGGGNMQYLDPSLVIDSNSDALVSTAATRGLDPLLEPLADNGGATPTRALGAGSPAIDAGVAQGAPPSDQRGEARDGAPDVGAFER